MLVRAVATILSERGHYKPKDIFELDDAIARDWINRGWVIPKNPKTEPVELAALEAPEHAVSRGGKRRHG